MSNCGKYQELLPEFLEGALDPDTAADVATHLAGCSECREDLGFVRSLMAEARRLPPPRPSDAVALRIMEANRNPGSPRRTDYGPVLNVEDLAEYLRLDVASLEPYLEDIPSFELGGKLLFRRQTVEEWIRHREESFGFAAEAAQRAPAGALESTQTGGVKWTL